MSNTSKSYILNAEQLDAYGEWRVTYDNFECYHCGDDNFSKLQEEWLVKNPCPLPEPISKLAESAEEMTPEEFVLQVSPNDNEGIRHELKKRNLLSHVYEWMRRYSSLNKEAHTEINNKLMREVLLKIQMVLDDENFDRNELLELTADIETSLTPIEEKEN